MDEAHQKKQKKSRLINFRWIGTTVIVTFVLSLVLNLTADSLLMYLPVFPSIFILFLIILLGIIFDIIGISVTSADPAPFHSMAARRVFGAKRAIQLIKNADKVSNFCNDVVGDIASIISGATVASIIAQISVAYSIKNVIWLSLVMTGLVAAITVGGKALGKTLAIIKGNDIIFFIARVISIFEIRKKGGRKSSNGKNIR